MMFLMVVLEGMFLLVMEEKGMRSITLGEARQGVIYLSYEQVMEAVL